MPSEMAICRWCGTSRLAMLIGHWEAALFWSWLVYLLASEPTDWAPSIATARGTRSGGTSNCSDQPQLDNRVVGPAVWLWGGESQWEWHLWLIGYQWRQRGQSRGEIGWYQPLTKIVIITKKWWKSVIYTQCTENKYTLFLQWRGLADYTTSI